MSQESRIRPIPKILALLFVSVFAAWYLHRSDLAALARMDNMTPEQYVAHQRAIHLHHVVTHWDKILGASQIMKKTIVVRGQIAGHISCYPDGERMEVTYWLGKEFWGRGLATQALDRMLRLVVHRPLFARAASDNLGSIRVLQKCGFGIIGNNRDFAHGRGEDTEEYILRLDLGPANR